MATNKGQPETAERWVGAGEARAVLFNCSYSQLYRYIKVGLLHPNNKLLPEMARGRTQNVYEFSLSELYELRARLSRGRHR